MAKNANPFETSFAKFFENFGTPQFDVEAIAALQQSNFEALSQVSQAAVDSFQAIAGRQAEMVRTGVEEAGKSVQKLVATKPDARFDETSKVATSAYEAAVANFSELTDLTVAQQTEAAAKINAIIAQNLSGFNAPKASTNGKA